MTGQKTFTDAARVQSVIEETLGGVRIRVRVQPRSSRNRVEGLHNNALKIRLTSPPVEGAANDGLVEFLSTLLGIKKSAIRIEAGEKSRDKAVFVEGITKAEVERALIMEKMGH